MERLAVVRRRVPIQFVPKPLLDRAGGASRGGDVGTLRGGEADREDSCLSAARARSCSRRDDSARVIRPGVSLRCSSDDRTKIVICGILCSEFEQAVKS